MRISQDLRTVIFTALQLFTFLVLTTSASFQDDPNSLSIEVHGCSLSNYAYWCLDNSSATINCSVPLYSLTQAQLTLKQKCDDSESIATALQPVGDIATLKYKYLVTNRSKVSQKFVCCYEKQSSEVVQVDRTCLEVYDSELMVSVRLSGFRVLYIQANGNLNGTLYYYDYNNSNETLLSIDCTQWWKQYYPCELQSGSKVKFATVNNESWYYSAEVCESEFNGFGNKDYEKASNTNFVYTNETTQNLIEQVEVITDSSAYVTVSSNAEALIVLQDNNSLFVVIAFASLTIVTLLLLVYYVWWRRHIRQLNLLIVNEMAVRLPLYSSPLTANAERSEYAVGNSRFVTMDNI